MEVKGNLSNKTKWFTKTAPAEQRWNKWTHFLISLLNMQRIKSWQTDIRSKIHHFSSHVMCLSNFVTRTTPKAQHKDHHLIFKKKIFSLALFDNVYMLYGHLDSMTLLEVLAVTPRGAINSTSSKYIYKLPYKYNNYHSCGKTSLFPHSQSQQCLSATSLHI